jgi:hypothetical protein
VLQVKSFGVLQKRVLEGKKEGCENIYIYMHLSRFLAKRSVNTSGQCDTEIRVTPAKHLNTCGCRLGSAITLSESNTKLPDLGVAVLG